MQPYFLGVYPDSYEDYSIMNAFLVSVCGFASCLSAGIISDNCEKRGVLMTKSYVCIIGTLLAIPCIIVCTMM